MGKQGWEGIAEKVEKMADGLMNMNAILGDAIRNSSKVAMTANAVMVRVSGDGAASMLCCNACDAIDPFTQENDMGYCRSCYAEVQEAFTARDRHSVGCYFCGKEFDERDGSPADEFNGGDGGTICPSCRDEMPDPGAAICEKCLKEVEASEIKEPRPMIALFREGDSWMARFTDPNVKAAMGTDTIPTAFRATAEEETVLEAIQVLNPEADVFIYSPGYCERCGQRFEAHNDDGSCVKD